MEHTVETLSFTCVTRKRRGWSGEETNRAVKLLIPEVAGSIILTKGVIIFPGLYRRKLGGCLSDIPASLPSASFQIYHSHPPFHSTIH